MPEDELPTSGEFSRRSRLSPKALRLYEQQDLLVPDEVDAASRYRRYRVGRLAEARLVVWLRRLDMPLADVARVLAAPAAERDALIAAYWEQAEARFAAQRRLAAWAREEVSGRHGGPSMSQNIPTREEPAHHEAYLRITKAQVAFPQILSAYHAVSRWITAEDEVATLPPRDVYFTDFMAAGPDDEVCDIAYPIRG